MAFAGMDDVVALGPHRCQHRLDRLDRRAHQRQIIAHMIDITAGAAEIGLHVDDDECGIIRTPIAVIGPGIGIGGKRVKFCLCGHIDDGSYSAADLAGLP